MDLLNNLLVYSQKLFLIKICSFLDMIEMRKYRIGKCKRTGAASETSIVEWTHNCWMISKELN